LLVQAECSDQEVQQFRRAIGSVIGRIQIEVLDLLYAQYPEIDDFKKTPSLLEPTITMITIQLE
jgi:hypothetical protein